MNGYMIPVIDKLKICYTLSDTSRLHELRDNPFYQHDDTELTNGKVNRRSTPEGTEVKTENGKHDWIVPKLTNPGRCTSL